MIKWHALFIKCKNHLRLSVEFNNRKVYTLIGKSGISAAFLELLL